MKKKSFLVILTALMLLLSSVGFAAAQSSGNSVTEAEAEKAAINHIERVGQRMDGWSNATLSKPVTYFAPDNTKSVYEFTVLNGDLEVGFIIVSARKDWMPVLEYSSDEAPSQRLTEVIHQSIEAKYISENEIAQPNYIYWGALSFSVQLSDIMKQEGTIIHLPTGRIMPMLKMPSLQMDKAEAQAAWNNLARDAKGDEGTRTIHVDLVSGSVPVWYQHSDSCECCDEYSGGADYYPDCAGIADDPWNNWDGCSAIAGAMILGYWDDNGYSGIPDDDETLIDDCHYYMNTTTGGTTLPIYIDGGIEGVFGRYSYDCDASNVWDFSWSDITTEIAADRPFELSMDNNPTYGDHSVTAFGCEWDDSDPDHKYIWVNTTWPTTQTDDILFGNWSDQFTLITKVVPD